jgi:AbrB family looped-hinge helix DNA binding protein
MPKVAVSRITSKGQVTIPEEIRRQYHLQAGEQIEWEVTESGTLEVRRSGGSLDDLVKILPRPARALTLEEMDRAVRARVAEKRRARR